jgi:hypothetical protein
MQKYRPFLIIAGILIVALLAVALLARSNRNSSVQLKAPTMATPDSKSLREYRLPQL